LNTLDHPSSIHIQAGNDPFRIHLAFKVIGKEGLIVSLEEVGFCRRMSQNPSLVFCPLLRP